MASPSTYLSLITSEHRDKPLFMALIAALVQGSVDQQYVLSTFSSLFDLDLAVGDQLDKLGAWIGVSRNLEAALSVTTYPTSTQLAVDTFTRANEDPLNIANWTTVPLLTALQILSDLCVPSVGSNIECAEYYSGVSLPADQYAEITVPFVAVAEPPLIVFARSTFTLGSVAGYEVVIEQPSSGVYITSLVLVAAGTETILASYDGVINPGDVIRLACTGDAIFVQKNGITIMSVVDTTAASGAAGVDLESNGSVTAVGISRFACGSYTPVVESVTSLDDEQYRVLLKLFVAMNAWNGTIPGIYSIWNSVFAAEGFKILVQDDEDMTMVVVFLNPPTDIVILAILTQGYFLLRPAGVQINGFYQPSLPFSAFPIFGFDAENATVSGFDVGAWMVPIAA